MACGIQGQVQRIVVVVGRCDDGDGGERHWHPSHQQRRCGEKHLWFTDNLL